MLLQMEMIDRVRSLCRRDDRVVAAFQPEAWLNEVAPPGAGPVSCTRPWPRATA